MNCKMALTITTNITAPLISTFSLCSPIVSIPILNFKTRNGAEFVVRKSKCKFSSLKFVRAVERDQEGITPLLQEEQGVEESVKVLKNAAKTRRVSAKQVLFALSLIKKTKIDPSPFLNTLGGTESPGRTWMLIFTAQGRLERGNYFPVTAVQRFDAAAMRIENGVYLGPLGSLTFEGRFSWKTKILAFIFECIKIKIGSFGPLKISLGKREEREPNTKDPFFIWFYVDEEIAIAQGRGGGTAFWCRCHRVVP